MKINPVNHAKGDSNRYCGPSAISIVTGMATGEAARLIRATSHVKQVQGTHDWQMKAAFAKCGITMNAQRVKPQEAKLVRGKLETRPTLTQWYKDSKAIRTAGRVFLISAGHHWQIVSGRRFCCGKTKGIVSITAKGTNRRARVEKVYELVARDTITIPVIARKVKTVRRADPNRTALLALEKRHGFKGSRRINIGVADYQVEPCPTFPHGFSTMHHGWDETLERVLHCLDPEVYASLADEDYHFSQ